MDIDDAPETDAYEIVDDRPALPDGVYRRLFEASFHLAVVADATGRIRALSDAAALFVGSDALGGPLVRAVWWDDPERIAEGVAAARAGAYDRFYTRATGVDGHRTLLVDVQAIDGPDDDVWTLLEARDVTTLLTTEHQLTDVLGQLDRERGRLRAVLDATPDRVVGVDAEGRATVANRAAVEAAPDAAPVEGEPYVERAPRPELWRRALGGEIVHVRATSSAEGATRWTEATYAPVRRGPLVEGAVAIERDVTGRVEAEHLRRAVGRGRLATLTVDAGGRLVAPSDRLFSLFGVDAAADLGALLAGAGDAGDVRAALADALAAPGQPVDLRLTVGDHGVWLRGRSVAVASGARFVGVAYETDAPDPAAEARWEAIAGRPGAARVDLTVEGRPDPDAVAARVAALRRTGVLDGPPSAALDALTRTVAEALGVPVALVSLVDTDRQVFQSQTGLPEPFATTGETPLSHSFCQHVANERRPLVVEDARETVRLATNRAIPDLGAVAYLGVPVAAPDGHVIGALCAIDSQPHAWTDDDVRLMSSLAEAVTAEVAQLQARTPE